MYIFVVVIGLTVASFLGRLLLQGRSSSDGPPAVSDAVRILVGTLIGGGIGWYVGVLVATAVVPEAQKMGEGIIESLGIVTFLMVAGGIGGGHLMRRR